MTIPNEDHTIPRWKEATNKKIVENLLVSCAELLNGKWYTTETLDYKGHRTRKYIIEHDITEDK